MPKDRSPYRDKAFEIYKEHNGKITNREIASMLNEDEKVIAVWKQRDKWTDKINVVQQSNESCTTNKKTNKLSVKEKPIEAEVIAIENTELTEKQRFFVAEYLKDFNATRAALAVGYSKNTAYSIGFNLLKKVEIQAEIKRQTEALFDSIGLTSQRILMEYMKLAAADISDYVTFGQREVPVMTMYGPLKDDEGNIIMKTVNYVDFKESSEVDGTLIQEVKQGKDGASIKLYDKQKALDTLAKYLKIIVGGVNINVQQNSINVTLEDD